MNRDRIPQRKKRRTDSSLAGGPSHTPARSGLYNQGAGSMRFWRRASRQEGIWPEASDLRGRRKDEQRVCVCPMCARAHVCACVCRSTCRPHVTRIFTPPPTRPSPLDNTLKTNRVQCFPPTWKPYKFVLLIVGLRGIFKIKVTWRAFLLKTCYRSNAE